MKDECIHCGACTRHCDFLNKYQMDIGDAERVEELAYHCFLCGKCKTVCPAGIDGREVFLEKRRELVTANKGKVAADGYDMLIKEKQNYIFRNYRNLTSGSVLFPGCNFPSFYPQTTKKLSALLKKEAGIGTVYDCCGKPIAELGLKAQEEKIIERMNRELKEAGVKAIRTNKIEQPSPNLMDLILGHKIDLVIDTQSQGVEHSKDGFLIRRTAIETGVNVLTAMDTARALVTSLENTDIKKLTLVDIATVKNLDQK